MDVYIDWLQKVCSDLEAIYGIGDERSDLDIEDICKIIRKDIDDLGQDIIDERNIKSVSSIGKLSLINSRLKFFSYNKVDFVNFYSMDSIFKVLRLFLKKDTINQETMGKVNDLVSYLSVVDREDLKLRFSLSYRFIRLFIVLVIHFNFSSASVVSDFILNQMEVN